MRTLFFYETSCKRQEAGTQPGKRQNNGSCNLHLFPRFAVNYCIILLYSVVTASFILTGVAHADKASKANKRGIEAYDNQNYEESVEHFTEALVESLDTPELKFNRGTALSELGKTEEALNELISSAIQLEKTDRSAAAHFNAGNTLFSTNNIETAIEEYKQAVKLDQSSEDIRHNLELAIRKLNQQQKSQEQQQEDSEEKEKKEDEEGEQQKNREEQEEQEEKDEKQSDKTKSPEDGEKQDQNQQPSNQQDNETLPMTPEEAQRLLDAINDEEKQALSQRYMQMKTDMRGGDDW